MIIFKLKDPHVDAETPIRMYCFLEGCKFYIYTRLKLHPNFWIKETQKVTLDTKLFRKGAEMNFRLKNLKLSAEFLELEYINSGVKLTKEDFKEKFEFKEFGIVPSRVLETPKEKSFVEQYSEYVDRLTELKGERRANSQQTTLSLIKRCFGEKANIFTFDDIDLKFHKRLMDFILYDNGLSVNYAGTTTARLKTYMNLTYLEGTHTNTQFLRFKRVSAKVDNVALREDELEKIIKQNLSMLPGHDRARDIFVLECLTCLRYSDVSTLQDANIDNEGCVQLVSKKTGKDTIIPIVHPEIQKILKKYNGFPPHMSSQKINKYIKEVAQLAKLKRPVLITKSVKGVLVTKEYELWQLIATHTGRRTALTNMADSGIPLKDMRSFSGHSSLQQLEIYLKSDGRDTARKYSDHSFFTGVKPVEEKK